MLVVLFRQGEKILVVARFIKSAKLIIQINHEEFNRIKSIKKRELNHLRVIQGSSIVVTLCVPPPVLLALHFFQIDRTIGEIALRLLQ